MRTANKRRRNNARLPGLAAAALTLLLSALSPAAAPQQQRPTGRRLPPFEVTALNGRVFASDKLPVRENWVLVYVRPNCRPCEAVFRALGDGRAAHASHVERAAARREGKAGGRAAARGRAAKGDGPETYFARVQDAPQKLVIVVGGATTEELRAMADEMPWVPQGVWYADPAGRLASAMKWQAAPIVAGVREGGVVWSYTGVPPEGMPLRSLMSNWHERPARPAAPAAAPPPRNP